MQSVDSDVMKLVKKALGLQLLWLLFFYQSYAQQGNPPPCSNVQEIKLDTDPLRRRILADFLGACIRNKEFLPKYDKGIIHLYQYQNAHGEECWLLMPLIDDSYKDNPPTRFSDFNGDIILVYDADSVGHPYKTTGDIAARNRCLEQIIGDRVFTRPPKRTRWTSMVLPISNRRMNEGNRRNLTGNGGDVIIIFDKKGGYRKSIPV